MKRTPSKLFFSALTATILCLFANSILYAASDEQSPTTPAGIDLELIQEELEFLKEETVSIAAAHEQPISEAPSNVYVITDEDIRQSGAVDLPSVLRRIPGLEIIQMTTGFFDVSMRGDNQLLSNKLLDSLYTGYRIPNQKRGGVFFEITAMLGSFFTESLWRPSSILFNLLIRRGG
jgi:outer membrane receptor protein involved in Fe transport